VNLRITILAALVVLFGITISFGSYLNLYIDRSMVVDSGDILPINTLSSSQITFYSNAITDLKTVEVIFIYGPAQLPSIWGTCNPIMHKFWWTLTDGLQNSVTQLTTDPPSVDNIVDAPSSFQGVWYLNITNPENYPADVVVTIVVHSVSINTASLSMMVCGVALIGVGTAIWLVAGRKEKNPIPSPPPS
jgi:hypothetical protein